MTDKLLVDTHLWEYISIEQVMHLLLHLHKNNKSFFTVDIDNEFEEFLLAECDFEDMNPKNIRNNIPFWWNVRMIEYARDRVASDPKGKKLFQEYVDIKAIENYLLNMKQSET